MTTIQARVDDKLKLQSEYVLRSMGLSMTSAINLFLQQVVTQRKIPFEIVAPQTPNPDTLQAMQDTIDGKNLHGPYHSVKEMLEALDA